jgi:hypothetical protein
MASVIRPLDKTARIVLGAIVWVRNVLKSSLSGSWQTNCAAKSMH